MVTQKHISWLSIVVHPLCLIPLALLVFDYLSGNLGVNPIQELTLRTGLYALILLLVSLACTPLHILLGWRHVLPLRKPLGLYAFGYVWLHGLTFVGLDYRFDLPLIWLDSADKPYIYAGLAAFGLLAPLALTSTRRAMRALGKRWKPLHRLVYAAAALAVVHWLWSVKSDMRVPLAYGAVLALLLVLRLPPVRRAITRARQRAITTN